MSDIRATWTRVAAPRKLVPPDLFQWNLFPYLMGVMILLTLVSLFHVWSRVRLVELNLQIGEASRVLKEQRQEQSRLRLEVASLKTPARIEALAKGELGMVLPADQQTVVVR